MSTLLLYFNYLEQPQLMGNQLVTATTFNQSKTAKTIHCFHRATTDFFLGARSLCPIFALV